jgi:hypothetical protein
MDPHHAEEAHPCGRLRVQCGSAPAAERGAVSLRVHPPAAEALAYASLGVCGKLVELLTSIWGLWLFPFAVLTIKSNFLPKFLGVLLILSGVAYVLSFLVAVLFPDRLDTLNTFAFPLYFGELVVILWLAFVGAKPRGGGEHGRPVGSLA